MGNEVLFVKYAGNQPVKIETHYIGGQERRRPLSDVADVIEAVKQALPHRFRSTPVDELTLHAVVDGVEGSALEPDLLVSDLTTGRTAKLALIIKSQNDMKVDKRAAALERARAFNPGLSRADAVPMEIDGHVSKPPVRRSPSDQFIIDNNLNLDKTEDVLRLLEFKIFSTGFKPEKPPQAVFRDNCLEFRLDSRQTGYSLDADNNIKVLLSVSGSGKTRQLLELLFNQFGYYFVVGFQLEDFGSGDLAECFRLSLITPGNVQYYVELLYFVHGFVCDFLIRAGFDTPDQILLAQLHPEAFFGLDIFLELYDFLVQRPERVIGRSTKHIANYFDFAAIDEIQATLGGGAAFRMTQSEDNRPFFSPLVYYSKRIGLKSFIVSGTGINFRLLKEFFFSGTMKDGVFTNYSVISGLEPLDKSKVVTYIRNVLTGRNFGDDQIKQVVDLISENPLFHGRGRFVAFILDCILGGHPVDLAISKFIRALSRPDSAAFPLRFYAEDIQLGRCSFKTFAGEALDTIVRQGLIRYLMTGEAVLDVRSDRIRHGAIRSWSVQLKELAVVECLRYLVPVSDLIPDICLQLASFPKPQMVGYLLEYLVGYALVAGLDQAKANSLITKHGNLTLYLTSSNENEILFPDHCCGPDIIYKHQGTLYIVQVKFLDTISKQERVTACHTTDPNHFYWNSRSNKTWVRADRVVSAVFGDTETSEVIPEDENVNVLEVENGVITESIAEPPLEDSVVTAVVEVTVANDSVAQPVTKETVIVIVDEPVEVIEKSIGVEPVSDENIYVIETVTEPASETIVITETVTEPGTETIVITETVTEDKPAESEVFTAVVASVEAVEAAVEPEQFVESVEEIPAEIHAPSETAVVEDTFVDSKEEIGKFCGNRRGHVSQDIVEEVLSVPEESVSESVTDRESRYIRCMRFDYTFIFSRADEWKRELQLH
ncbi:hypothetical protein HDU83_000525 [Entophlyctis luteolus]|nr:hypothetical protein HDU83_000525 [Entophlyctis luteolus]